MMASWQCTAVLLFGVGGKNCAIARQFSCNRYGALILIAGFLSGNRAVFHHFEESVHQHQHSMTTPRVAKANNFHRICWRMTIDAFFGTVTPYRWSVFA